MRIGRYRGRHLIPRRRRRGVAVGAATAVLSSAPAAAAAGEYVVRPGDTLSAIATRFGTSVARLAHLNRLRDPDRIVAGRTLRTSGSTGAPRGASYVVRPGDTLSAIAARFGTTVDALAAANGLSNPNFVVAGTRLSVSGRRWSAPATARSAPLATATPSVETSLANHAAAYGLDPALVKAVAEVESSWRQDVRSSSVAIGVMQLLPSTARYVNESLGGGGLDPRVTDENVQLGVLYLRHLIATMGSEERALAAYYTGPGNVGTNLDATQRWYVDRVMEARARYA